MNPTWRRSGVNNPYMNGEVAWQHIQDLQREAETRRMPVAAGREPVELRALAWLRRNVAPLASRVRQQRPEAELSDSRTKVA